MAGTITIGCRLPHGLTIYHPADPKRRITLRGLNSTIIKGIRQASYVLTDVDAELWSAWKTFYKGYPPLENGAIFEAKNANDAQAIGKEVEKEKTGFEPLIPNTEGIKTLKSN